MNEIEIKLSNSISEGGTAFQEIHLLIDSMDLIQMLRAFERPFAEREGAPDLAGGYSGIPKGFYKASHFEGGDRPLSGKNENKTILLHCACGDAFCWPFLCRIEWTRTTVIWSDFEQPHRTEEAAAGLWDYSAFGPFEFDLQQYKAELLKL